MTLWIGSDRLENNFRLPGLMVSIAGAVILLAIVNLLRRGRVN